MNQNLHTKSATVKHSNPENSQTLTKNSQKHPKKIPENQQIPNIQHTVASDFPKQVRNEANEQTSTTKAKMHVPNGNMEKKGCCRDTKSSTGKNSRVLYSEKQRKTQKEEEAKTLRKNAVGKIQTEGTVCYL